MINCVKVFYKTVLMLLVAYLFAMAQHASAQYAGDALLGHKKAGQVYMQILRNTNRQPPHNPARLAAAFEQSAAKYGLNAQLLAAIAAVESGYFVGAINSRTADYGIMQINAFNIAFYKFNKRLLLTDIEYSVDAGARVLSWFYKKYAKKEKNWFCRYNVGTRKLQGSLLRICKSYSRKVRRAL